MRFLIIYSLNKYLLSTYIHRAPILVTGDIKVNESMIPAFMELAVQRKVTEYKQTLPRRFHIVISALKKTEEEDCWRIAAEGKDTPLDVL